MSFCLVTRNISSLMRRFLIVILLVSFNIETCFAALPDPEVYELTYSYNAAIPDSFKSNTTTDSDRSEWLAWVFEETTGGLMTEAVSRIITWGSIGIRHVVGSAVGLVLGVLLATEDVGAQYCYVGEVLLMRDGLLVDNPVADVEYVVAVSFPTPVTTCVNQFPFENITAEDNNHNIIATSKFLTTQEYLQYANGDHANFYILKDTISFPSEGTYKVAGNPNPVSGYFPGKEYSVAPDDMPPEIFGVTIGGVPVNGGNFSTINRSQYSNNEIEAFARDNGDLYSIEIKINNIGKAGEGPFFDTEPRNVNYPWNTTAIPNSINRIDINAYDANGNNVSFTFYVDFNGPSPLTLSSPDGGNSLVVGDTISLLWNSQYTGGYTKLEISRNGGSSWNTIVDSTPNDGSYTWTVTGPTSSNCLIRISSTSNPSITDTSDAPFAITSYCSGHDLKMFQATASSGSIKLTGSTDVNIAVRNNGPGTETNIPVTLTVSGPGYSDSAATTVSSIGPGLISPTFAMPWTPGVNGWNSATMEGAYTLTASVMSANGCDATPTDNQLSTPVYASASGTPPAHHAFQVQYYEIPEGQTFSFSGHTFEFNSYSSSSGEATIYVDGKRFYLEQDEGNFTSDLQVIFWWHRMVNSVPRVMHLVAGVAADNKVLNPYQVTVPQGTTAVFQDPQGYNEDYVFNVTASSDTKPNFDASEEPEGTFDDSGSTIKIGTASMTPGTHRFAILTDQPYSPGVVEYIAFGRVDVVAPQYTLTLQPSGSGTGQARVTIAGTSSTVTLPYSVAVANGTSVQIQAIPDSGSRFVNWAGDLSGATNPSSFTISSNRVITANFTKTYSLSVANVGDGLGTLMANTNPISVPYTNTFDQDTVVNLQATANNGSVFSGWTGDLSGSVNPTTVTMTGNRTINAEFLKQYTLGVSINTSEMGRVFANESELATGDSITLKSGEIAYLYASAKPGYKFIGWSGDVTGSDATTSVAMDRAKNVTATFAVAANCSYTVIPSGLSASFTSNGGAGSIQVNAANGCAWAASESAGWINITAGSSGNGNGTVSYTVAENLTTTPREATITVAGKNFLIHQYPIIQKGDIDGSGTIDLGDAVKALKLTVGMPIVGTLFKEADVNNDGRIGVTEALYALNVSAAPPVGTVVSAGRIWMDRNLGASRVAISSTDTAAYGDLYQWGRGTDGHEKRTSGMTTNLSGSDVPGHGNFILTQNPPHDWHTPQNANLWQGVSGGNNPCPAGFRLPTRAEWEAERASWSSNNRTGAFNSPLKLCTAGLRFSDSGTIRYNNDGYYWSGSADGSTSFGLFIDPTNSGFSSNYRAHGFSLRCIKD